MASAESDASSSSFSASNKASESTDRNLSGFCIIEGSEMVRDFAKMELQQIQGNIKSIRNKIFLHMEEVCRLRIQQGIKNVELGIVSMEEVNEHPDFPSFIPFLPLLTPANMKQHYATCFLLITGIILFSGVLAPTIYNIGKRNPSKLSNNATARSYSERADSFLNSETRCY